MESRGPAAIEALASLGDRQRSRLYDAVRAARRPVTREEAASKVDISRKLAAFHLDKLVAAGLLEVTSSPDVGPRRVGRTPKWYRPVDETMSVSIPGRSYQELATVLVLAAATEEPDESSEQARHRVGRARGLELGAALATPGLGQDLSVDEALDLVVRVLAQEGFEPYRTGCGSLRLANCPFHPVTGHAPTLVCGINVDYLSGLLEGLGVESLSVEFSLIPNECCVEIQAGD